MSENFQKPKKRRGPGAKVKAIIAASQGKRPRKQKAKAIPGKPSLFVYMTEFWSVSTTTIYHWIEREWDIGNLPDMCRNIIASKAKPPLKARAQHLLSELRKGRTINYYGEDWTLPKEEHDLSPTEQIADVMPPEFTTVQPMTLDEAFEYYGRQMRLATDANDFTSIAQWHEPFKEIAAAYRQAKLAEQKLGIDSLEIITRENFTRLLWILAWCCCSRADTITTRIAKAATNKKTPSDVYRVVHPIVFQMAFESPFVEIQAQAMDIGLPDWVINELRDTFAAYVANGEKLLDRFIALRQSTKQKAQE